LARSRPLADLKHSILAGEKMAPNPSSHTGSRGPQKYFPEGSCRITETTDHKTETTTLYLLVALSFGNSTEDTMSNNNNNNNNSSEIVDSPTDPAFWDSPNGEQFWMG
jgi:hypothetical protein